MERTDPPSTRCTFIITTDHAELFDSGSPGDRIEMHEKRDAQPTGRVLTARILALWQIDRSLLV
jgi:hypothetical protein